MKESKDLQIQKDTNELLADINDRIKRMNSYRHRFTTAIVHGIGYAIGFTLIAGIILGIISSVVDSVHDLPILNDIIEKTELDDALNQD